MVCTVSIARIELRIKIIVGDYVRVHILVIYHEHATRLPSELPCTSRAKWPFVCGLDGSSVGSPLLVGVLPSGWAEGGFT